MPVSQNIKAAMSASGSAPVFGCRAWVNFNGTGTVVINSSGNVSSITDNGVGDYTINFNTAMNDANYSVVGSAGGAGGSTTNGGIAVGIPASGTPIKSITQVQIATFVASAGYQDRPDVSVAIFR